ncbi:MAG TPA: phosphatase PAP2 family protein [Polyangiaceae bacterium]|nr:phosphatase PAP2 family protein [Polyangiaceae bacterium]
MSASPSAARPTERHETRAVSGGFLAEIAVHDWLVLAYVVGLVVAVLQGDRGPSFGHNLERVLILFASAVIGVSIARGSFLRDGLLKAILYRVAIYGPVQLSYFMFRDLLPSINPGSLDAELHQLDLSLFGIEPAMALQSSVNSHTTEWFAFFYFGYFFVIAVHVVPILFFSRNQRTLGEFGFGMLILFCVGHTVYMLVPGFGPYRAMAEQFTTPFPHGLWLDLVMDTVHSGGAQKDIFPSLHTAAPAFITLYSFRHRSRLPYRYTWPLTAFFTANIMIATMFLRWHYLIDVVAGLILATTAALLIGPVIDWELRRRARGRRTPLWPLLRPAVSRTNP